MRGQSPPDEALASALEDLGTTVEWPKADVADAVRARLVPRRAGWSAAGWAGSRAGRLALAAVAVILTISAVLSVSSGARRAVAGWLGLRGVEIRYPDPTAPSPRSLGSGMSLGEPVPLAEARRRLTFTPLLPPASALGVPDAAYVSPFPSGGRLTVVYGARPGLPEAASTGEGLLLTEFRGEIDAAAVRKQLTAGGLLEEVTVAGGRGYWFGGTPHQLFFADAEGRFYEDSSRLAGNTLVWEQGDLTLRLESALSKEDSIRLAESLAG